MDSSSELIVDFVNTLHKDVNGHEEHFVRPADIGLWLRSRGLLDSARPTTRDLEHTLALREALRTLLLANNGVEVDVTAASRTVEEVARRARLELRLAGCTASLEPQARGVDGALGRVVAAMHDAVVAGDWPRLKACRARDCEWAFADEARNQSRAWCSMRSCGNREKARAFRRRHAVAT